jgi:MFS family permease
MISAPQKYSGGEPALTPLRRWITVAVLGILAICSYFDRGVIAILVEPIRADLRITDFQLSLVTGAAFALFHAACALPLGWMVDRYSRRWIIFAGVTVWALSAAGTGLSRNFWQLFGFRLGVGAGEAALSPAAYSIIGDTMPRNRIAFAMSVYALGAVVGSAGALFVGGYLFDILSAIGPQQVPILGLLQPWQLVCVLTGLPGLLLAFLIFLVPKTKRRAEMRPEALNTRELWVRMSRERLYLFGHFAGYAMIGTMGGSVMAWYPTFLIREYGIAPTEVGLMVGLTILIAGSAGTLASGLISDWLFARGWRSGHILYGAASAAIMAASGLVGFTNASLTLSVLCFGTIFFFTVASPSAVAHLALVFGTRMLGRMTALFLLFYTTVSVTVGASLTAFFTDFVFRDPDRLGASLALTFGLVGPVGVLLLLIAAKAGARAISRTEAAEAACR